MPPPAATVTAYSHVTLMVDDLDAAIGFYRDVFGFEPLPRPEAFGPGAWLQVGTAQLHLGVVAERPTHGPGLPHLALLVPADRWDATMAAIADRGVGFLMGPTEREDFGRPVRAAFVEDPAGNVVELTDVDPGAVPRHGSRG